MASSPFYFLFMLLSALVLAANAQTVEHGNLFNFIPGLGACGFTNTSTQFVASVSSAVFHAFPGSGTNPNNNPICTHSATVTSGAISVTAQIVDFFTEQGVDSNIGFSTSAFAVFADPSVGIVQNVSWVIN